MVLSIVMCPILVTRVSMKQLMCQWYEVKVWVVLSGQWPQEMWLVHGGARIWVGSRSRCWPLVETQERPSWWRMHHGRCRLWLWERLAPKERYPQLDFMCRGLVYFYRGTPMWQCRAMTQFLSTLARGWVLHSCILHLTPLGCYINMFP